MIIQLLALQLMVSQGAVEYEWKSNQKDNYCSEELAQMIGGSFVIIKDSTEPNTIYFEISNSAWSHKFSGDKELTMKYITSPFRDSSGKMRPSLSLSLSPTPVFAREAVVPVRGNDQLALIFSIERKIFDALVKGSQIGLRISINYLDTPLTDWIKIDEAISSRLDRCNDPFSK